MYSTFLLLKLNKKNFFNYFYFFVNYSIMKSYSGKYLTKKQKVFNYRLSRARRTVESAFGIYANRWRVFHTA